MNKIAILIINWNDYSNTKECLDSLIKNNFESEYNIILLDNNSIDGSREKLCAEYSLQLVSPLKWQCEKNDVFKNDDGFSNYTGGNVCLQLNDNYGFTGANNFGMKFAYQHKFQNIMWLNNDTIVNKGLIGKLEIALEKHPHSLISCRIVFFPDIQYIWNLGGKFNYYGKPISPNYKKDSKKIKYKKYISSIFCSGCLIFYSRDTLERLGGQDNNYFFNIDDSDYSYNAFQKGIGTIIDTETILYHKSARSVVGKPGLSMYYGLRNLIYFRKKFFKWYQNIGIYIYVLIHAIGIFIVYGLQGQNTFKFIINLFSDIYNEKYGKYTNS